MRRILLGLTVALSALALAVGMAAPSGAAKPAGGGSTRPAALPYSTLPAQPTFPTQGCILTFTWDPAQAAPAPKGYVLEYVAFASSHDPVSNWDQAVTDYASIFHVPVADGTTDIFWEYLTYGTFNMAAVYTKTVKGRTVDLLSTWGPATTYRSVSC